MGSDNLTLINLCLNIVECFISDYQKWNKFGTLTIKNGVTLRLKLHHYE